MDYTEYQDLAELGITSKEPVKPEDEFFHSIYIAGQLRKNHADVEEQPGKIQIRGVEYNLDEVHFIITHTKEVLAKIINKNKKDSLECFSFKDGAPPWFGTTKLADGTPRPCPLNSNERALNEFCSQCRSQIIVAGIYCEPNGKPITVDNKPVFVFIRGKGMKYNNVSTYLADLYKMELTPFFEPSNEETLKFEKAVVNQKRFVTKAKVGTANSNYGVKQVFTLETGAQLPDENVKGILKIAQKTKDKFKEKFDWSASRTASTYAPKQQTAEGVMTMDSPQNEGDASEENTPPPEEAPESKPFSFEDIDLDNI